MPPVLSRTTTNTPSSSTPGVFWRSYTVKSRPLKSATPSQVPSQIRPSSPWATVCTRLCDKPSSMFQRVTVWYAVCVSACALAGQTPSTAQHTRSHGNARPIRRTHVLRTQLVCARTDPSHAPRSLVRVRWRDLPVCTGTLAANLSPGFFLHRLPWIPDSCRKRHDTENQTDGIVNGMNRHPV